MLVHGQGASLAPSIRAEEPRSEIWKRGSEETAQHAGGNTEDHSRRKEKGGALSDHSVTGRRSGINLGVLFLLLAFRGLSRVDEEQAGRQQIGRHKTIPCSM